MLACDYPPAETWARSRYRGLASQPEDDANQLDQEDRSPTELDIDQVAFASFRHLLGLYRFKMATPYPIENAPDDMGFCMPDGLVVAGGLQQYLIKLAQKQNSNSNSKPKLYVEQPRKGAGTSEHLTFHDLPVNKHWESYRS